MLEGRHLSSANQEESALRFQLFKYTAAHHGFFVAYRTSFVAARERAYLRIELTKLGSLQAKLDRWAKVEFPTDPEADAKMLVRKLIQLYAREAARPESARKGTATPLARLKFIRGSLLADKERGAEVTALHTFLRGNPASTRQARAKKLRSAGDEGGTPVPSAYRQGWDNLFLACIQYVSTPDAFKAVEVALNMDGEVPFSTTVRPASEAGFPGAERQLEYESGILDAKMALWSFMRTLRFLDEFPEFATVSGYDDHLAFNDDDTLAKLEWQRDEIDPQAGQQPTPAVVKRIAHRGRVKKQA